ncbi:MAG: histidine kinase, partial [Ramlibacter sp.]|nr:histidine kinase [Ramlibacter sp.]
MSSNQIVPPATQPPFLGWLARVNTQVSQWAASMSWWRLIVLFLVILVASSIIGDMLHLKHDRVRLAGEHRDVNLTIGGPNGIRIRTVPKPPAAPAVPGAPGAPTAPADAKADPADVEKAIGKAVENGVTIATSGADIDADDERPVNRKVITVGGLLGDLGAAVLVILFAYLAAAKIVVRKVAQADAKVRTAVDAAEREAMERQLVQARLRVLQAQVEPHFLFNTLAAVDYLIETEPPRASRMQKALITYLRGALPQMRQESSTLGREIRL